MPVNKLTAQLRTFTFILLAHLSCQTSVASAVTDAEAMELGYRVAAAREALQNPWAPGSMQAITDLGHDQRYYVMVRGWLMYQLQADMSLLQAAHDRNRDALRERIEFVEEAIRAIDLE